MWVEDGGEGEGTNKKEKNTYNMQLFINILWQDLGHSIF